MAILGIVLAQFVGNIDAVEAVSINVATKENNIDKLYIALNAVNDNGWGYRYGTSTRNIWSMVSYEKDGTKIGSTNNLYCAQADYGSTWEEQGTSAIATYNLVYDFDSNIGTTASTVINSLVSGEYFNEILWLVDNMYVPGESNKTKFLEAADIYYDESEGGYIYISTNGHDYYDLVSSESHGNYILTDDDIIAIQQAALWYFTNNGNSNYNKKGIASWLQYTNDGSNYYYLTSYSNRNEGAARNEFATVLFNYFVDEATSVASELGTEKYELEKSTVRLWLSTSDDGADNKEQPLLEIHKLKEFDLSLRKAIVSVQSEEGETKALNNVYGASAERVLKDDNSIKSIDLSTLNSGTTASYYHRKDPIVVEEGDIVEYSITIYNESEADGYAKVIVDQLPLTGLILQSNDDVTSSTGNVYEVNYTVTENKIELNLISENPTIIPAYDGTTLSYETITLKCVVTAKVEEEKAQILTNIAYISVEHNSDTDEDISTSKVGPDRDSATGVYPVFQGTENDDMQNGVTYWNTTSPDYGYTGDSKNSTDLSNSNVYYKGIEDDDDFEKIIVMPIKDITVTKTWNDENDIIPHVQINKKNIDKTTIKFVYSIKVTNEGQIAGEATEITDYVPEGLVFVAEDNQYWTDEGNNVISTKQLEGSTLEPGESVEAEVTLRWVNGADNLGAKTNVAEISEDYNEFLVADKDSTPDNRKDGEDDIDDATVLLSVNQGGGIQSIYINLCVVFLVIILVGGVLIKKFVL